MNTTLSNFLREQRLAAGLTQGQLAKAALGDARKQSWVSRWETGSATPSAINLLRISDVLGLQLSDYTPVYREPQQ